MPIKKNFLTFITFVLAFAGKSQAQTIFVPGGTIGNSGASNVGIGINTPGTKLQIVGPFTPGLMQLAIQSSGTDDRSGISFLNVAGARTGYIDFANNGDLVLSRDQVGEIRMFSGGLERLTIGSTGNVGIAAQSPGSELQVGAGSIDAQLRLGSDTGSYRRLVFFDTAATPTKNNFEIAEQELDNALFIGPSSAIGGTSFDTSKGIALQSNGNVGIGNTAPTHRLDVNGDGAFFKDAAFQVTAQNTSGGTRTSGFNLRIDNFDLWQEITDNAAGNKYFIQYNGSTSNRFFTVDTSGNVGIGTTNPTQKLSVNGTILAKEVIVQTGWSDYVFADDYALPALSDVETEVKRTRHLPGIPSADDVAHHGVSLGEMQAKLLAKIEEITLHQIAQEKKIAHLEAENTRLSSRLAQMEKP